MTVTHRLHPDAPAASILNRELSWLDLNGRVLDLTADPAEPLLERIKFCGIFSSNLDEFFMVRVAGLLDQVVSGAAVRTSDGRTPQQTLGEIRTRALELTAEQSRLWRSSLCPALAAEGIVIGTVDDATDDEREELELIFAHQIYPVLTPLAVGPGQPFPYISGLSLSLGVVVRDPETGEERFARVKVPEGLPRFVAVGARGLHIPLESAIAHFLPWLFPEMELIEQAAFRLTRDGDTEISDDADDLLEAVESELQRRRFGAVVRLEVSSSISGAMLSRLTERLGVRQRWRLSGQGAARPGRRRPALRARPAGPQVRAVAAVHAAAARRTDRREPLRTRSRRATSWCSTPTTRSRRASRRSCGRGQGPRVGDAEDDRLPHEPRLGTRSRADRASENGKQSVCVVELKARFDEQRNIEWARSLEQAGVHVVYGFPDMKIHAKTTLVVRREGDDAAPLRPHRHRQLPRDDGAHLRGRRALHGRPRHRSRRRRPVQLRDGLRPAATVPQDPRRAVQPASRPRRSHPRRRRRRRSGPARAHHGSR